VSAEQQKERLFDISQNYSFAIQTDVDLVSSIIGTTKEKAKRIIEASGNICAIEKMSMHELSKIMTKKQAEKIKAAITFSKRITDRKKNRPFIGCPGDAFYYVFDILRDLQIEHFVAFFLNTKHFLIAHEIISIGSLSQNIVHPREVLKKAIEYRASSIILAHNHPSGDPTPSQEDIVMTNRIDQACQIIGIDLIDHIIVGDLNVSSYVSMKEQGLF
jgi:DNA repair protein RadC